MTEPTGNGVAESVESTLTPHRLAALKAAVLIVLASAPFLPTLRGPYFWDDAQNIEINRALRTTAGLKAIWTDPYASFQYYPLTYSLFWFQFQWFGEKPFGYHVVNLILHAGNALLVWRTLIAIRAPAPWWVAALFAVHPIQVETVGWISEQKNLLSTGFALLALRFWEMSFEKKSAIDSRRAYVVATILFVAAIAAKSVALVLPYWIAVEEFTLRRRPTGEWLRLLSIWFVVGLAAGAMTSWRETANSTPTGPAVTPPVLNLDERMLLSCQSLWRYVGMLSCLEPLVPIPTRSAPSWSNPNAIVSLLGALAVIWFAVGECRRSRPWVLLGLTFFALQIGPTLGLIRFQFQCHSFVANHFAYFGCVGFFIAAAALIGESKTIRLRLLGTVALAALTATTWSHSRVFADPLMLWQANIEANPNAWAAHLNLADLLFKDGRPSEALERAKSAVELEPSAAMGHENLGMALAQLGRPREAERAFREALRLRPDDPQCHHNLANALVQQNRFREAIEEYHRAAVKAPEFLLTHYLMGEAYRKLEMIPEARAAMKRALEIDPSFQRAQKAVELLDRPARNQLK